jgi:hypothetical protein
VSELHKNRVTTLQHRTGPTPEGLTCYRIVELPGIEPVTETAVTCTNTDPNNAKSTEMTRNYLRIRESVDGVNTFADLCSLLLGC